MCIVIVHIHAKWLAEARGWGGGSGGGGGGEVPLKKLSSFQYIKIEVFVLRNQEANL